MENKLMMSQKEECTNYNLITENINKLVNMCGNTKEAIEIRDNLFDLFTIKYSEPLFTVLGLQEDLGCPLEVLGKALKNGIYRYNKNYEPNFRKEKVLYLGNEYGRYYITWLGCWREYLDNYKKTWWLKEDRSM